MKLHIRTVLLAITVLIEFPELNSSPVSNGEGSSNLRHQELLIKYRDRDIWVTLDQDNITPLRCSLIVPRGTRQIIPDLEYRKHHNYETRALIKDNIKCVIFIENNEVLGVKLPPTEHAYTRLPSGHPGRLNPDASKWFITFGGLDYEVKNDLHLGIVAGIELMPANVVPTPLYYYTNKVETYFITFAGVSFIVYLRRDINKIVGAYLNPHWQDRAILHTE